jgi:hypothetical protein
VPYLQVRKGEWIEIGSEINNLEKRKNLLLNVGNVAKMLPVKSEGACSLTLVPGPAHLIYSGKFKNEVASNSPPAISKLFLERPTIRLTRTLVSLHKLIFR